MKNLHCSVLHIFMWTSRMFNYYRCIERSAKLDPRGNEQGSNPRRRGETTVRHGGCAPVFAAFWRSCWRATRTESHPALLGKPSHGPTWRWLCSRMRCCVWKPPCWTSIHYSRRTTAASTNSMALRSGSLNAPIACSESKFQVYEPIY